LRACRLRLGAHRRDFIAACLPEYTGSLIGDKATSVVFDNSKIKRFVPDFVATTRFARAWPVRSPGSMPILHAV
jgi:hypothetical protein